MTRSHCTRLLQAASLALLSLSACPSDDSMSTPDDTTTSSTTGEDSSTGGDATPTTDGSTTTDSMVDSTGSESTEAGECVVEPAMEVPLSIDNGIGTLHGTLLLPEACPPFDVVLIHVGSGPTDRDGNSILAEGSNDSLKLLAEALQDAGLASIRYDKRGVAESAGAIQPDPLELRFDDYAEDLERWIDLVRAEENFGDLTLLGHSEGALIAKVASGSSPPERLISLVGAGRPAADVLREQFMEQLEGALLDEALMILDQLEQGMTVDMVSPELNNIFHPTIQPYVISWLAYDPAEVLGALDGPALIVAGTTDIQIPVSDAERLADARPDAELCVVEGMNHVLKEATLDPDSQDQAYNDPSLPLVPGLTDCLLAFLDGDS